MTQQSDKKLFLLDAMALIYRSYFAFSKNPRINSKGINTSAVLGFANTVLDLLKKENPTHIGVAFDTIEPTKRHIEFEQYKANREKMPEDIAIALPYIREFLSALKIPILELGGYEADDVVGTLSKKAEKDGYKVYMVTSDKDYGQLVSDNIFMYKPSRMGGGVDIMGVEQVCDKYGIQRPEQLIDILGLAGDASDNIPGVPGVGPVTACKMLSQFGSIEELIENSSQIKPSSWGDKMREYSQQAILSKSLATIILDVPLKFEPESLVLEEPDVSSITALLSELEMASFASRLWAYYENKSGKKAEEKKQNITKRQDKKEQKIQKEWNSLDEAKTDFEAIFANSQSLSFTFAIKSYASKGVIKSAQAPVQNSLFSFQETEESNQDKEQSFSDSQMPFMSLWAFADSEKGAYCYYPHNPLLNQEKEWLNKILLARDKQWMVYDIKQLWHTFKEAGLDTDLMEKQQMCRDIMLAHYVVNPEVSHKLEVMAESYTGKLCEILTDEEQRAVQEVCFIPAIWKNLVSELRDTNTKQLFEEIEMPLAYVLCHMEENGIRLDTDRLNKYGLELEVQIEELRKQIFSFSGVEFNISSPKQLGEMLYDKLQITDKPKHTKKKQLSTAEDVLQKLVDKHPIVSLVLQYRSLTKLKSTYVDALPLLINRKTNKIHSTFNQAVAATGRLSSQNPNLQNIPVRSEMGREIRKAFIPDKEEDLLLSADYSQIELRIIAYLSGDKSMLSDFSKHKDVHTSTAAKVFNVSLDEVDSQMRRMAKMVNFGIIYGISAFGLAERLGINRKEAHSLIEKYFIQYPQLKEYMDKTVEEAKTKGYVKTLCNRRRYIPDINSANAVVRGYAERNAINAPVQGSSADMIKIAMVRIDKILKEKSCEAKMILQVHDELIFNVPEKEVEKVREIVEYEMKNAIVLSVPLEVDIHAAKNWSDAH